MQQNKEYSYIGDELDIFAQAVRWKSYVRSRVQRYLRGDILEVGAGIGGTTRRLCDGQQESWTCLEPDASLAARLEEHVHGAAVVPRPEILTGGLEALAPSRLFDTVLYIDVLEHIEDDGGELVRASRHLDAGGALVVLSPACQFLYTAFDTAVGHFRRYDKKRLRALTPPGTTVERLEYLDFAGMFLSLSNRLLLRSGSPSLGQIRLWDRLCVPLSRIVDPLIGRLAGKSILGVWRGPC